MLLAYLDPATGSMIISAVVAGTAGAGVAMRTMMAKFRPGKGTKTAAATEAAASDIGTQPSR